MAIRLESVSVKKQKYIVLMISVTTPNHEFVGLVRHIKCAGAEDNPLRTDRAEMYEIAGALQSVQRMVADAVIFCRVSC
jgi:hypothetical protein